MKLVSVLETRAALGFQSTNDVNHKLNIALDTTTTLLSELLETNFDQGARIDKFFISKEQHPFIGSFVSLKLSNGFVNVTPAVEVRTASFLSSLPAGELVNMAEVEINYEKGLVLITYEGSYLPSIYRSRFEGDLFTQVAYTSGFATQGTEYGPVFTNIPEWLKRVAIYTALNVYNTLVNTDLKDPLKGLRAMMLDRHIRFSPASFIPVV